MEKWLPKVLFCSALAIMAVQKRKVPARVQQRVRVRQNSLRPVIVDRKLPRSDDCELQLAPTHYIPNETDLLAEL
jgi:hypothetical protein